MTIQLADGTSAATGAMVRIVMFDFHSIEWTHGDLN